MGSAPRIPPQPPFKFPPLPPFPSFSFEMPSMPTYDPEAVERKKQRARDAELGSILKRKERGREGTIKTGPLGVSDDELAPVQRPGLIAR